MFRSLNRATTPPFFLASILGEFSRSLQSGVNISVFVKWILTLFLRQWLKTERASVCVNRSKPRIRGYNKVVRQHPYSVGR